MNRQLPNLISALRVPLALLFVLFDGLWARLAIVAIAGLSDMFDGRIARALGIASRTGEWLDPAADKAFMIVALVTLSIERDLPGWVLPLLLLRDIGVVLGALLLLALGRARTHVRARKAGKWVTWLQFVSIAVILMAPWLAVWIAPPMALLGALALADYARALRAPEPAT